VTGTAVAAPPDADHTPSVRSHVPGSRDVADQVRRSLVAGVLLLLVYPCLSFALNDPRGTLGTDTGGKLATLHMMEQNGGLDPDIGYWAERYDRGGVLHPLHYTYRIEGKWVNVTTLPMLYAAYPLYRFGGDRAVVLLPMLGAVLCAFAARALARRFGGGDGWSAFWIVGLASPVAVYALDFWEHTIGLGLMLWAVVLLLDVLERRSTWRAALGAGTLFGAAASMRTEALVYLVVATGLTCLVMLVRERAWRRPILTGLSALVGAGGLVVANRLLEQAILGSDLRGSRVASTASNAGGGAPDRVREALTTFVGTGMSGLRPSSEWVVGALAVAAVAVGAWCLAQEDRRRVALGTAVFAIGTVIYLVRFAQGWGFVPGLLVASPFAAVGIVVAWTKPALRLPAAIACVALPIAWYAQYQGGADPQWGGRYVLLSGALLAIVGCVYLRGRPRAFVAVVVLAALTTLAGIGWLSVRSHTIADGMATIVGRHDQLVISRQTHLLREGGAFYDSRQHWLTAATDGQLREALRIARASGATEFALIGGGDQPMPRTLGGYARGGTQLVSFVRPDMKIAVTTYRRP